MKPISKVLFITICLLFISSGMSYGQVNIKERVEINPSDKNVLRSVNEDYPPILISVISPSQTYITVTGPGVEAEGSGDGGEFTILEVPSANGTYYVTIYVFIGAGGTSIASYWADWDDQSIGNGSHYVSNAGGETDDYVPTTFSFTFSQIPELNDFTIFFLNDEICGLVGAPLRATTNGIKVDGINLNISLQDEGIGAVIYDVINNTPLGTSTTTTFGYVSKLSVVIDSLYSGDEDKTIVVTGEAEGMTRTDELTVKSAKQYADFIIRPYPDKPTELYKGMATWIYGYTYRGGGCGIAWENLPEDIKYNFAITKGQSHGYLAHRPAGYKISERGTEIYDVENSYGSGSVIYQSYSVPSLSNDTVIVNISTTDPEVEPVDVELYLSRNPIYTYADPDPVAIGDTSQIVIKHFTSSGEVVDFPEDQLFYVEVYEGKDYGTLYSSAKGDTAHCFDDVPGNFSFIAADEIDADSVSALLWVWVYLENEEGTSAQNLSVKGNNLSRRDSFEKIRNELIENRRLMPSPGNARDKTFFEKDNLMLKQLNKGSSVMAGGDWYYTEFEIIIKRQIEAKVFKILLGESKYFGVQKKVTTDKAKYQIVEIPTDYGNEPDTSSVTLKEGWHWEASDLWGTNPIEVLSEKDSAKPGVYWEKKFPTLKEKEYDGSYYIGRKLDEMKNLPTGIIRVIGRYWEEGKEDEYKVKLKASNKTEIFVKVKRPEKLGDSFNERKDVFGNDINIDSVCIVTGGKNGIPPQIIKGQMLKESSFKNSYRYEPHRDYEAQTNLKVKNKYITKYNYFTVTSTSMGTVSMPSNHTNVQPVPYNDSPKTIDKYIISEIRFYTVKPSGADPYFIGWKGGIISKKLVKFYNLAVDEEKTNPLSVARDSLTTWLKVSSEFVGKGKIAQTRIFSSYGMLQQTFYAASDVSLAGFNVGNKDLPPEYLNEMDHSIKAYVARLKGKLKTSNNWAEGYEKDWENTYDDYNPGENGYEQTVLKYSTIYLPK